MLKKKKEYTIKRIQISIKKPYPAYGVNVPFDFSSLFHYYKNIDFVFKSTTLSCFTIKNIVRQHPKIINMQLKLVKKNAYSYHRLLYTAGVTKWRPVDIYKKK